MTKKKRIRLAVYSVLIGDKEILNDPLQVVGLPPPGHDVDMSFYCFTDDLSRTSPTWKFLSLDHPLLPVEKLSRLPKTQPDRYFPDHPYSLYIDNTVVFKRLPRHWDIEGALFRGFRHPWRTRPLDEADIVVKSGLDEADVVARQLNFYARTSALDSIDTLTAGTVLLRCHVDPRIQRFGQLWWEQILCFSKRDQISLDLCAREAGCPVEYFEGNKTDNDLFLWPVLADGHRVWSSFDAARYAWEHRHEPAARANPQAHFLTHGGTEEKYARRVPWFRYACDRVGSGLADVAAPRRGLADIVQRALNAATAPPSKMLLVAIDSASNHKMESEELVSVEAAIKQCFRFAKVPDVVTSKVSERDVHDSAPFRGANGQAGFDIVMVFGLPVECHANALAKFLPLIAAGGRLLVEFDDSLDLSAMQRMYEGAGKSGVLEVYHGRHIDTVEVIPGNVFVLQAAV